MATRYCPSGRRALQIGLLLVICTSIALIYFVNDALKRILLIPGQLWFCSIGFELTPSYATSAFSCEASTEAATNGPIFFLEGNEAYGHTMSHLSNDSHYHVGAEEISNISKMFSKLISASIERTRNYVHAATLSYPYLPGLANNNIGTDIMRQAFAKIDTISHVSYEQVLSSLETASGDIHASHAVLAGHGLGLCQPWRSEEDCECARHQDLPKDTYLLAAYYSHGIEIVLTEETTSVYDLQSYTYNNYSLGYHSKPSTNVDGQQMAYYWDNVREFFRNALLEHPGLIPRTAILYGDRCTDKQFQAVLVEVLYQVLGRENVNWLQDGVDPIFAGALGAAELLKRKRLRQLCLNGQRKIVDVSEVRRAPCSKSSSGHPCDFVKVIQSARCDCVKVQFFADSTSKSHYHAVHECLTFFRTASLPPPGWSIRPPPKCQGTP